MEESRLAVQPWERRLLETYQAHQERQATGGLWQSITFTAFASLPRS